MSRDHDQSVAIKADLWPGGSWQEEDVQDLMQMVAPFGETAGQRSYRMRGMGLQVTLSFVGVAIAGGFFAALGEHLYAHLSKRIMAFLRRPAQRHPEWGAHGGRDGLFFAIHDPELKLDFQLYGYFRNETEIHDFLHAAPIAYLTIVQAVQEGRSPCIRGKAHSIRAVWCEAGKQEWSITVLVTEGDVPDQRTPLLSLSAFVANGKLSPSDWPYIQWMDLRAASRRWMSGAQL